MTNVQRLTSEEAVQAKTGRGWEEWLAVLDEWGAVERKRRSSACSRRSSTPQAQLNVTSASSIVCAPAAQCRRAARASRAQPVRSNSPSVSTASVLPSQR
jgi:hypothetical protein